MKKVTWKENRVISIESRSGNFVIAQMLKPSRLMIFHNFRKENSWNDIDLSTTPLLFCIPMTRQFFGKANIVVQDRVKPVAGLKDPNRWIMNSGEAIDTVVFKGTPFEKTFLTIGGGGKLIEEKKDVNGLYDGQSTIISSISASDNEVIDKHEIMALGGYGEFNERLYLCSLFNKNVCPAKDILFNRPMPLEYKTYIDIVSGSIEEEEWLALPPIR